MTLMAEDIGTQVINQDYAQYSLADSESLTKPLDRRRSLVKKGGLDVSLQLQIKSAGVGLQQMQALTQHVSTVQDPCCCRNWKSTLRGHSLRVRLPS